MALKTVGQFTPEASVLSDAKVYMEEQDNALVDKTLAGVDAVFKSAAERSLVIQTTIFIRVQTYYVGWVGFKTSEGSKRDG